MQTDSPTRFGLLPISFCNIELLLIYAFSQVRLKNISCCIATNIACRVPLSFSLFGSCLLWTTSLWHRLFVSRLGVLASSYAFLLNPQFGRLPTNPRLSKSGKLESRLTLLDLFRTCSFIEKKRVRLILTLATKTFVNGEIMIP